MRFLIDSLILWPQRTARHLEWLAPLFARIVTGWVFTGGASASLKSFQTRAFDTSLLLREETKPD